MLNFAPVAETSGGTPTPMTRTAPDAVSAAGVRDPAALSRQQLPSAVPAPVQVVPYAAYMPPAYRPPIRTVSSPLAAQFIAQVGEAEASGLMDIFELPTPPPAPSNDASDDYLQDMRLARGEPTVAATTNPARATKTATAPTTAEPGIIEPGGVSQRAAALPALSLIIGQPAGLAGVRGIGAYQLASARNAAARKSMPAPDP